MWIPGWLLWIRREVNGAPAGQGRVGKEMDDGPAWIVSLNRR